MMNSDNLPKILVVDDRPENLFAMRTMLKSIQAELVEASSGVEAISQTLNHDFAMILMDVQMPEMNGFEAAEMIRENDETSQIPIIFVTAIDRDDSYAQAGYEAGAVDFLFKPVDRQILISKVNVFLDLYRVQKKFSDQAKELAKANRLQNELVHILCHDLMNPFASIISMIDVFEDMPEEIISMIPDIKIMSKNGIEVINLVRSMMSLEEKGLEVMPIKLHKCIEFSGQILKSKLLEKNINLEVLVAEDTTIMAEEASLINSVFNNLFTNAIKFSPEGKSITVESTVSENLVIVKVRDRGVGMPEKLLGDLFDISKKTSRPGTKGESGTGFGMPLIQKFMHAYGGDIDVESRSEEEFPEDSGTTIILEFKKG